MITKANHDNALGKPQPKNVREVKNILTTLDLLLGCKNRPLNQKKSKEAKLERLTQFTKDYPQAKQDYKSMQTWYALNAKKAKHDGVFVPSSELQAISPYIELMAQNWHKMSDDEKEQVKRYACGLQVFGAWRYTLGVYKLDEDITLSLMEAGLPDDTPASVFDHLPEWCVYMDAGFFAMYDIVDGQKCLCLFTDPLNMPIRLPITDGNIRDELIKHWREHTKPGDPIQDAKDEYNMLKQAYAMLSILLWLCVEEPDISTIHGEPISREELKKPKYQVNKRTGVFVPPDAVKTYYLGSRLGGEVRKMKERIKDSENGRLPHTKRPHIRRGHWQGYWVGQRGSANQEYKIRWQPAIFVNAK